MTRVKHGVGFLAVASLMATLSSCTSSAPRDTFGLSVSEVSNAAARHRNRQLLITEPVALKTLDSENIVIQVSNREYQYLGESQWSDRLPKMVQVKLAQAFESSGQVAGAGLPGEGLAIDEQIQTTIRSFEISLGMHAAVVEIAVRVLNDRNGTVRARKVFRAVEPLSGSDNSSYAAALDHAFTRVTSEIVIWTLGVI